MLTPRVPVLFLMADTGGGHRPRRGRSAGRSAGYPGGSPRCCATRWAAPARPAAAPDHRAVRPGDPAGARLLGRRLSSQRLPARDVAAAGDAAAVATGRWPGGAAHRPAVIVSCHPLTGVAAVGGPAPAAPGGGADRGHRPGPPHAAWRCGPAPTGGPALRRRWRRAAPAGVAAAVSVAGLPVTSGYGSGRPDARGRAAPDAGPGRAAVPGRAGRRRRGLRRPGRRRAGDPGRIRRGRTGGHLRPQPAAARAGSDGRAARSRGPAEGPGVRARHGRLAALRGRGVTKAGPGHDRRGRLLRHAAAAHLAPAGPGTGNAGLVIAAGAGRPARGARAMPARSAGCAMIPARWPRCAPPRPARPPGCRRRPPRCWPPWPIAGGQRRLTAARHA